MRAVVVVDLGFGDAGKGLLTDYLTRALGATLVVRYNGGAQAGHNVVTPDGRHHTFAQLGAGSFVEGVGTVLSRHVVVHPTALLVEAAALEGQGVRDPLARLRVSEEARLVTPFQQAANRLRELARGQARHGSCGVGVGEAVEDAQSYPGLSPIARDLDDPSRLTANVRRLREVKKAQMEALAASDDDPRVARERRVFTEEGLVEEWVAAATELARRGCVVADGQIARELRDAGTVVFEGAQGVLLDQEHGFHPYTTWSCCSARNALQLIREADPDARVERVGVLRCYVVRHGPGPLPTESATFGPVVEEHNRDGEWQGPVRYGWFDAPLARYALAACGGVDALALTHLDLPPRVGTWGVCGAYRLEPSPADALVTRDGAGLVGTLRFPAPAGAGALAPVLRAATPIVEPVEATEEGARRAVERLLGRAVDIVARGPSAADVARVTP